jgi:hypothetical protein
MDRFYRPAFSPDATFRCVKPFVMNGVAYGLGSEVDTTNIEVRRLRQMYDSRIVEIAPPASAAGKPAATRAPKKETVAMGKAEAPTKVEAPKDQPPAESAGIGLRAEHRGFGRYVLVDASGAEVEGPMTKAEADRRVAEAA